MSTPQDDAGVPVEPRDDAVALRVYLGHAYDSSALGEASFPLADEPFVAIWRRWRDEARDADAASVLARQLPQLAFPVATGMSADDAYRAATRRGVAVDGLPSASGLDLPVPAALELELYPSAAGRVPILTVRDRATFVVVLQALVGRNEPVPIGDSQGAAMVAGYVNWRRIDALREAWEQAEPDSREGDTWREAFAAIRADKSQYQDRMIILSDGPYSAVPAVDLNVPEDRWRRLSAIIRRDHECAHYLTQRLFGGMRNHLLDELVADYAGLVAALGRFEPSWFLRFLGLGDGLPPEGARAWLYRGKPPLSDAAFERVCEVVVSAAHKLGAFDAEHPLPVGDAGAAARRLGWLATSGLLALAEDATYERIAAAEARAPRDTVRPISHQVGRPARPEAQE